MANVIRKATNKFTKGLVMDFSPENTKNEVLTHALNATLLTFNGNELSLQNDMGNARVETAYLPNGYMPVGTCEYGGIIYIVSYNPLENKSLIGCFPSPERNISQKELGHNTEVIDSAKFTDGSGKIHNNSYKVLLKQSNLNPGDKFLIHSNPELVKNRLKDLLIKKDDTYKEIDNPIIALNVVSIEDSGKIVYLNNTVHRYDFNIDETLYKYFITPNADSNGNLIDLDSYRNVLSSGYSVFKEKTSGKLAILAELITIDSYSVTHSILKGDDGTFDVIIHTEVSPDLTNQTYDKDPKLSYYYLEDSKGYLQGNNLVYKMDLPNFMNTKLSDVYTSESDELKKNLDVTLTESKAVFNFPKQKTYHRRERVLNDNEEFDNDNPLLTTEFKERAYHRVSLSQLDLDYFINDLLAKFYTFNGDSETYEEYTEETINWDYVYYTKQPVITYINVERDVAYLETPLYKLEVILAVADASVILNKEIEKFKDEEIEIYKKATDEDIENNDTFYLKIADNSYKKVFKPLDPNITHYIKEIKITKVSLGFEIESEQVPSVVYYYTNSPTYSRATQEDLDIYWNFDTYPDKAPFDLFRRLEDFEYVQASESFLENYTQGTDKIYTKYGYLPINFDLVLPNSDSILVILPKTTMVKYDKFQPEVGVNYIEGYNPPIEVYPGEKPIKLYVVELYLPIKPIENNDLGIYEDVKLASLKLPELVDKNNLTFPFKYDYTLIPCMEFGKLDYLKVSNSIDFSKLYLFDKSEFNVWKYRVDGNLLVLTIGASVYDTFETNKVDALVLEFYDSGGPVGLLEISGKKSYSGQFTKVLGLDEYRLLKKLCVTDYGTYGSIDLSDGSEEDDRIGIIKSNTIYAIKPYFRVAEALNSEKFTFILKNPMVLITLPVNNWAYSSVDNFNNISEIPLSMVLTYRMLDISKHKLIESEDENVIEYKTGTYEKTDLNFKSTINYTGETQLLLAIGLHKDYELFGLFSDVNLDEVFECKLLLDAIDGLDFGFKDQKLELGPLSISLYNFLQKEEGENKDPYIHIEYEFTVSYDTYINDIRKTSIPATTVCALYHKQPDGIYNYSDFGLYEITNGDISCYLSDLVFYNSGSKSESIFGTARMALTDDLHMYFLCIPQRQFVQDTVPLSVAGRLNAGEPLRSVINSVGKLAFCQPHAHVLLEDSYKSNITYNNNGYLIKFGNGDLCDDIVTRPVYNMSANTIDMIDYLSKFISTVLYNKNDNDLYNGLNQYELAKFNRLLLNSMSGIYAYNPDYSSFPIRVGSVSVSNPTQQFNSNLYCTYSKFNFNSKDNKSLNDYLFLTKTINNNEVLTVSDYLTKLNEKVKGLPRILFTPETTYCGSEELPYLISLLTYNLEVPDELYRNLEFDFENGLFVMHSDGSWNFLEGSINKNTLYGFLSQNNKKKLIQLDVTTYNIDENGFVKIKDNAKDIINTETITITPSDEVSTQLSKSIELSFTDVDVNLYEDYDSKCDITWEIPNLEHKQKIDNWVYGFADLRIGNISKISASYTITSKSKTSNMNVGVISQPKIEMVIVSNIPNSNSIVLLDIKDPNDLKWFFGEDPSGRNLTLNNGETITYFGNCSPGVDFESTQLLTGLKTLIVSNFDTNTVVFAIIRCKVEDIDIKVSIYKNILDIEDTVIHVNRTTNYFRRNGNIYYNYYLDTCFKGSTITINDLLYKPELSGHRLYIRDLYSPVTGAKIYYRQDEKIDDYGLNYINLFSGPCYTGLFVDEADPEFDMEKKFNSQ